jgi:hypothetical protein
MDRNSFLMGLYNPSLPILEELERTHDEDGNLLDKLEGFRDEGAD